MTSLLKIPKYSWEGAGYFQPMSNGDGPYVYYDDSIDNCPQISVCGSVEWYDSWNSRDTEHPTSNDVWVSLAGPDEPYQEYSLRNLSVQEAMAVGEKLARIFLDKGKEAMFTEMDNLDFDIEV